MYFTILPNFETDSTETYYANERYISVKKAYDIGRESGERQKNATGPKLVRLHWFLMLAGPIYKISVQDGAFDPIASCGGCFRERRTCRYRDQFPHLDRKSPTQQGMPIYFDSPARLGVAQVAC